MYDFGYLNLVNLVIKDNNICYVIQYGYWLCQSDFNTGIENGTPSCAHGKLISLRKSGSRAL